MLAELTVPSSSDDPFSLEAIAAGPKFVVDLCEPAPILWLEKYGAYCTGRHEVTQKVLRDWKTFTSTVKAFGPREHIPNILVAEDPPEHSAHRDPIMKLFSPVALAKYEDYFDRCADLLATELVRRGRVDGFSDVAAGYVLKVFPDILGLKTVDRHRLLEFGDLAFNSTMPANDLYRDCKARSGDVLEWFNKQCLREAVTTDGLASEIYALGDDGAVTAEVAYLLVRGIFTGGFDTTVLSIASGLKAFADNPDQWDMVRADPSLIKSAFEEVIRIDPPSRFLGRGVTEDTELAGVSLKKGDRIACFLGASGRDPRKWENPDRFDITRKGVMGHTSFGFGLHSCLGQALARMEFKAIMTALSKHVGRIELDGLPVRNLNNQASGWKSLPLRLIA
ncbi:cytochrome P450 [Agrobacterium rhizogenes]|uniref:cytochrome P450 n=1 Tax=Rhizobium rhizogenes TaxID=359 RepID=UPI0015743951|nr:cytochrome P450 [Rhizobium rhizogenes]NTH16727.1 cytochrome P450 [Rhizobium rhizogenes]